jgi:hypothetical protein
VPHCSWGNYTNGTIKKGAILEVIVTIQPSSGIYMGFWAIESFNMAKSVKICQNMEKVKKM